MQDSNSALLTLIPMKDLFAMGRQVIVQVDNSCYRVNALVNIGRVKF